MGIAFKEAVETYEKSPKIEYDHELLDRLERLILAHRPQSVPEIIDMLVVIIPNVEAGGRGDGADVEALENIMTHLRSIA